MGGDKSDFKVVHDRLAGMLESVDGWLHPAEAVVLYRAAQAAAVRRPDPVLAELGSWHGRSTIALARGLVDADAAGIVYAVDPHECVDNLAALQAHLRAVDADRIVRIVRARSHDARPLVPDANIDVLFIDGDHSYDAVRQDIEDWTSALRAPAVVGFNDFQLPGVARTLRESVLLSRSPFRRPRWMACTLFVDYDPAAPWRLRDAVGLWRARTFLRLGSWWQAPYSRLQGSPRPSLQRFRRPAGWIHMKLVYPMMRACLPMAD